MVWIACRKCGKGYFGSEQEKKPFEYLRSCRISHSKRTDDEGNIACSDGKLGKGRGMINPGGELKTQGST